MAGLVSVMTGDLTGVAGCAGSVPESDGVSGVVGSCFPLTLL